MRSTLLHSPHQHLNPQWKSLHVLLLMSGQKNYKQRRRTPLLFLTGRSPEVIFPLPWNKSMKHNSLWTIIHLLKSDVGWGASHHHTYSVCWQRRTLINKPVLWNRCPSKSLVLRGNSENGLIGDCLLFCVKPLGCCVSFPQSHQAAFSINNDTFNSDIEFCRISKNALNGRFLAKNWSILKICQKYFGIW